MDEKPGISPKALIHGAMFALLLWGILAIVWFA